MALCADGFFVTINNLNDPGQCISIGPLMEKCILDFIFLLKYYNVGRYLFVKFIRDIYVFFCVCKLYTLYQILFYKYIQYVQILFCAVDFINKSCICLINNLIINNNCY